nr:hypothetical protein [Tanacetum cinerariifolium]
MTSLGSSPCLNTRTVRPKSSEGNLGDHTVETDIVILMIGTESFDMSADDFDKKTGSSDGLQPKQANLKVLMIDCLSIVETDKVNHTVETDIVILMIGTESFDMSADDFDKKTGSSDGLQPKQANLSCVHASNELHLHEIHVVPSTHKVDQC